MLTPEAIVRPCSSAPSLPCAKLLPTSIFMQISYVERTFFYVSRKTHHTSTAPSKSRSIVIIPFAAKFRTRLTIDCRAVSAICVCSKVNWLVSASTAATDSADKLLRNLLRIAGRTSWSARAIMLASSTCKIVRTAESFRLSTSLKVKIRSWI